MRLWHEQLIPYLPRQQLLGQHRECCALRGKGWGKPHATVNYIFNHSPYRLFLYHREIMMEMDKRGYRHDPLWDDPYYRGKNSPNHTEASLYQKETKLKISFPIYPEHNKSYLAECLANLHSKGVELPACLSSPNE
ncbi:TIGR02328 family protein [Virgibacillus sediminis]|uniref:TIGR02328 family protein n=1 Tax=Virgibacillus sediminis TaxID=202260 RepID=A0ABV7AA07_9BACI